MLRVRTYSRGPYWVVSLAGEFTFGQASAFLERVCDLFLRHPTQTLHLVVDLDRVCACDLAGLGAMVALLRRVQERGGRLALTPLPAVAVPWLVDSGFTREDDVTVYPSLAAALANRPPSPGHPGHLAPA